MDLLPKLRPRIWTKLQMSADEIDQVRESARDRILEHLSRSPDQFQNTSHLRWTLLSYLRFATLEWIRRRREVSFTSQFDRSDPAPTPPQSAYSKEILDRLRAKAAHDKYASFALEVQLGRTTIEQYATVHGLHESSAKQYFLRGLRSLKDMLLSLIQDSH